MKIIDQLIRTALAAAMSIPLLLLATAPAKAQSDPLLGQMMLIGGNFCPRNWANADGQLLAISQNDALFSILGTIYGGDGRTTFGLPDLRGRVAINNGTGPGLPPYRIGQKGGTNSTTLNVAQMPSHNHLVNANNGQNGFADKRGPADDFLGSPNFNHPSNPAEDILIYSDQAPNVTMDSRMISNSGGNQPFNIQDPFLAMTWCIAINGVFPSRN